MIGTDSISAQQARAVIRSLSRGTTIPEGVRLINVGHERWFAAQRELLAEIAEDGHSDTKFVRGAYGSGKSHFLSFVQESAREEGWATSHVECKADGVQIDRFETLYPQIARKMRLPSSDSNAEALSPMVQLLENWTASILQKCNIKTGVLFRPLDADQKIQSYLDAQFGRGNLAPDFVRAVTVFARARVAGDAQTTHRVAEWLSGWQAGFEIPEAYSMRSGVNARLRKPYVLKPIGKANSVDALQAILWLVRATGYCGLVLCIDEVEELSKLGSKRRQDQALQALREFVDHCGGDGGFRHLCMYLAATPEMFESEQYFPRYDALATRIQAVGPEINWRAPIVDLDRTPLDSEQLKAMATRICEIHRIAYGPAQLSETLMAGLADRIAQSRLRIAKPRHLARVAVDLLERNRDGAAPITVEAIETAISAAARSISLEGV